MSATLSYEPVRPSKYKTLPYELKHKFSEKFSLKDGSSTLTSSDVPYLEGVRDGSIQQIAVDVQRLIDCINTFGEVKLWLQY